MLSKYVRVSERRRGLSVKSGAEQTHNTTYLYYLGTDNNEITGGWIKGGYNRGTVNIYNRGTYIEVVSSNTSGICTNNPINVSNYAYHGMCIEQYPSFSGVNYSSVIGMIANKAVVSATPQPIYAYVGNDHIRSKLIRGASINQSLSLYSYACIDGWGNGSTTQKLYASFLAKADDISVLSQYGTDIATILSNASALLSNRNAVELMVLICTGEFMWKAIANTTFMNALNSSSNRSLVYDNEEWGKALALLS